MRTSVTLHLKVAKGVNPTRAIPFGRGLVGVTPFVPQRQEKMDRDAATEFQRSLALYDVWLARLHEGRTRGFYREGA